MKDIFWIVPDADIPASRLAIVLRPTGDEWLRDELSRMRDAGIGTLVSMLEHWEADYLGLDQEEKIAKEVGLNFLFYPIPDRTVPSDKTSFHRFIDGLVTRLQNKESVGVHCRGSIGRSTIVVASILIHFGWTPDSALSAIEAARGCSVPDTEEQREWILDYEAHP